MRLISLGGLGMPFLNLFRYHAFCLHQSAQTAPGGVDPCLFQSGLEPMTTISPPALAEYWLHNVLYPFVFHGMFPWLFLFPSIVTTAAHLHHLTQYFHRVLFFLYLNKPITLYPLREKMFKAFFKISLSSVTGRNSACKALKSSMLTLCPSP